MTSTTVLKQSENQIDATSTHQDEVGLQRVKPGHRRLVISDRASGICSDYLDYARGCRFEDADGSVELITESDCLLKELVPLHVPEEVVVFLDGTISPRTLKISSLLLRLSQHVALRCVVVITSLRSHLDSSVERELDRLFAERLKPQFAELTILRTGVVISRTSPVTRWCNRFRWGHPLISTKLSATFVTLSRLHRIVEQEFEIQHSTDVPRAFVNSSGVRTLTVLGDRRLWKAVCAEQQGTAPGAIESFLTLLSQIAALLGLRWLIAVSIRLLSRFSTAIRAMTFETLSPRSVESLLQLCNRHSYDDIQIAGYNNGVNHFGWKFPSKTVVLTTSVEGQTELQRLEPETSDSADSSKQSHSLAHLATGRLITSSGLTLKRCIDELSKSAREFFVIPNYSYISMGTLFFVPVHGSGSRVSTLGDTIEEVDLWNSRTETIVTMRRGDEQFQAAMYNTKAHWVVLKLTLLVRNKETYSVRRDILDNVTADEVLGFLNDPQWSNVEIRKTQASSSTIELSRYRVNEEVSLPTTIQRSATLDAPRDQIGRVWDRLEETPVAATLFHWFVRTFAFHVELFLTPDEFRVFWNHHHSLPVSKIQLRRVIKDGLPNSACQHNDCVSADLFMTRGKRDVFCQFIAQQLPNVRTNPGKQSF